MSRLPCPYLRGEVELSDERLTHIATQHPELPPDVGDFIANTLLDPDTVRSDHRFAGTRLFSRWFDDLLQGKLLVVAVVTDEPHPASGGAVRHWIVTAYPTRRVTQGVIEWARP